MVFSSNAATVRDGFPQWRNSCNYALEFLTLIGLEKSVWAYVKSVRDTNPAFLLGWLMKKRKQPNPKFHVGDKVHCLTIDLYGRRLTVRSSRYIDFLGCHVYTLEDEKGQQVHRGNHVSSEIPEHFLQSAESILERYIRLQSP